MFSSSPSHLWRPPGELYPPLQGVMFGSHRVLEYLPLNESTITLSSISIEVENGCNWKVTTEELLLKEPIFHFHDYWRKGSTEYEIRLVSGSTLSSMSTKVWRSTGAHMDVLVHTNFSESFCSTRLTLLHLTKEQFESQLHVVYILDALKELPRAKEKQKYICSDATSFRLLTFQHTQKIGLTGLRNPFLDMALDIPSWIRLTIPRGEVSSYINGNTTYQWFPGSPLRKKKLQDTWTPPGRQYVAGPAKSHKLSFLLRHGSASAKLRRCLQHLG